MTLFIAAFFFFFAPPARADEYAKPTLDNLVRTDVRFGALDIKDNALLDEYAMITDCDLVTYFYGDDFKWDKVRGKIRQSIGINIGAFPSRYRYDAKLQLDRYDFDEKLFRFTAKTAVHNVNSFVLFDTEEQVCNGRRIKYLPLVYRAVLDVPVSIPGLPLADKDADALLRRMRDSGNDDHIIYTRFNLEVAYVEPLRKAQLASEQLKYTQPDVPATAGHAMRFDVRLDSVDFYEDAEMTRLIYSYRM